MKMARIWEGTCGSWGRRRGVSLTLTGSGMAHMPITAGTNSARLTQNVRRSGEPAHCERIPASSGPQPRPAMFASVATSVARPRRSGGARSTRVAVAVPVKMPAESPERMRPTSSSGRPLAVKKQTALRADSPRPGSSSRLRPTSSDRRPKRSSAAITPAA